MDAPSRERERTILSLLERQKRTSANAAVLGIKKVSGTLERSLKSEADLAFDLKAF